jgi:hypothetical protein
MVPARTKLPGAQGKSIAKLLALLGLSAHASPAEVDWGFVALHRLAEALPLTSDEFCFAHNWLTSAQTCWEADDANTACYQLAAVVRKLGLVTANEAHITRGPRP